MFEQDQSHSVHLGNVNGAASADFVVAMFLYETALSRWVDGPGSGGGSTSYEETFARKLMLAREHAIKKAQSFIQKQGGDAPENVMFLYRSALAKGCKVFAMALRTYAKARWPERFVPDLFASNGSARDGARIVDDAEGTSDHP